MTTASSERSTIERSTRQRTAMLEAFRSVKRPLLATVYRNLKALTDEGTLVQVLLPGENPRCELAGHELTLYGRCSDCAASV